MVTPHVPALNSTPFMGQFSKEGVVFETMHTGSTSSLRSGFCTMCGVNPPPVEEPKREHPVPLYPCLPEILRDQYDFDTSLFSGSTFTWGRSYEVMRQFGFSYMYADREIRRDTKKGPLRWVAYDDNLVLPAIEKLLTELPRDKRLFWHIHTAVTHFDFSLPKGAEHRKWKLPDENIHWKDKEPDFSRYMDALYFVDKFYQKCVELLMAHGRNTLFVINGDHGIPLGEHGVITPGSIPWNTLYEVPFIMIGKHELLPPGTRRNGSYHLTDATRTMATLLNVTWPDNPMQGRDLTKPEEFNFEEDTLFAACRIPQSCLMAWRGRYKAIWTARFEDEFYDWVDDQEEVYPLETEGHPDEHIFKQMMIDLDDFRIEYPKKWTNFFAGY